MKYRILAVLPLAFGTAHLVLFSYLAAEPWYLQLANGETIAVNVLALLGATAAAAMFKTGDRLRRAWSLVAWSYVPFIASDLFFPALVPSLIGNDASNVIRGLVVAAGNVLFVVSLWMLANTWQAVGLPFRGPMWVKRLVVVGAIGVTILLVAPSIVSGLRDTLSGDFHTWEVMLSMVSGAGDLIALSLVAPMLLTALSLRGGLLSWPWIFLTCILVSWLGFDAVHSWAPAELSAVDRRGWYEFFRVTACIYGAAAGLAQRFVMQDVRAKGVTTTAVQTKGLGAAG